MHDATPVTQESIFMSVKNLHTSMLNHAHRPLPRPLKKTITAIVLSGLLAPMLAQAAEPAGNTSSVIASINGKELMKEGFLTFVNSRIPGDQSAHLN